MGFVKKYIIMVLCLMGLQIADVVITHYCLETGLIYEANPFFKPLFANFSPISIALLKVVLTGIILTLGFKFFFKNMYSCLIIANILMIGIVSFNIYSYISVQY